MIFIDFDDTIYNTRAFKKKYFELFHKVGISKEIFDETYYSMDENSVGEIYDFEKHLKKLEKITSKNQDSLKSEVRKFLNNTAEFVFKDFFKFANNYKNKDLILLSYGKQPFQGLKIKSSGISKYFKRVIVTSGKKSSIVQSLIAENNYYGKIFFVDDRPDQLDEVIATIKDVIPIRVKRTQGRYKDLQTNHKRIHEVASLKNVASYINEHGG